MARIYNNMQAPIMVISGTMFIPNGGIIIQPGQRSDSLDWSGSNTVSVFGGLLNGDGVEGAVNMSLLLCVFEFGVHAQIQGGNYAMIQPGSYLVYDSNHDQIASAL